MIFLRKTPNEKKPHTVSMSPMLPVDEEVGSVSSITAVDSDGTDVSSSLIDGSGVVESPNITFVTKKIAADVYTISIKYTTSPGSYDLEELVVLKVIEGG